MEEQHCSELICRVQENVHDDQAKHVYSKKKVHDVTASAEIVSLRETVVEEEQGCQDHEAQHQGNQNESDENMGEVHCAQASWFIVVIDAVTLEQFEQGSHYWTDLKS